MSEQLAEGCEWGPLLLDKLERLVAHAWLDGFGTGFGVGVTLCLATATIFAWLHCRRRP